jgi:ParB-like chromosome segregation protein Spo0J
MARKLKAEAREIQIETWPIDKVIPYAKNPRRNDHAVDLMAATIREFGFVIPILCKSSGELIDGHLRLKAGLKLELETVPVIICDDWTDAQVKAFRLQVNKSTEWAEWDPKMLAGELLDLNFADFDLNLTGFTIPEIGEVVSGLFDAGGTTKGGKRKLPGESMAENGLVFRVIVDATSEAHQAELLRQFKAKGLKVKPLIS